MVASRTAHRMVVVRGIRGKCDNCSRDVTMTSEAIPRWQRRGLRWRFKTFVSRFQYHRTYDN